MSTPSPATPKIAIVHDWLYSGGAEAVIKALHELYPDAPIYTSYCSDEWRRKLDNKVITGYLQHWPFSKIRRLLPLLRQWWFARLNLSDYDIILSSSGNGEAKFVRKTRPDQLHICYCHTPTHFYWKHYESYLKQPSFKPYWLARLGLRTLVRPLRKRDYNAAQMVDLFIANSYSIADDIEEFYDRDSTVIFPPIATDGFKTMSETRKQTHIPNKPRCLVWGRIVPQKRLDIAIGACNQLGWQLDIMGDGPDSDRLSKLAGPTVAFPGYVTNEERERYITNADLFLFCSYEDFGIAPVEALAAGLPVVAYRAGGALDFIKDRENGWFFNEQTTRSLVSVLKSLPGKPIDPRAISRSAAAFDQTFFVKHMRDFIHESWSNHENRH